MSAYDIKNISQEEHDKVYAVYEKAIECISDKRSISVDRVVHCGDYDREVDAIIEANTKIAPTDVRTYGIVRWREENL